MFRRGLVLKFEFLLSFDSLKKTTFGQVLAIVTQRGGTEARQDSRFQFMLLQLS